MPVIPDENEPEGNYILDQGVFLASFLELDEEPEYMALLFHFALADAIAETCCRLCRSEGLSKVALSGGVWANMLLWRRVKARLLAENIEVYTNESYPCGDGGIAVGQAFLQRQGLLEQQDS